jgi:hypothetical protein
MTGKERILLTLEGGTPDRVPYVPNIWQWYHVNKERGTLPAELRLAGNPVEALRAIQADVMSKFDGKVLKEELNRCRLTTSFRMGAATTVPQWTSFASFEHGNVREEKMETPHGTLTHIWEYEASNGSPFETEYWWKDFDAEYAAVRDWMEDAAWRPDTGALREGLARVGDDGIVLFQLLPTPLKQFHWLAGPELASLFLYDHPEEMRELARIHEKKSLQVLEEVVDLPGIQVYELAEALDSRFYAPALFRELCLPVLKKLAEMIHARRRYLFVHACGRLKVLAPLLKESGLDCIEGQAHPPLGDWRLDEARALGLIVCGGMSAHEQEWSGPDAVDRIDRYVRTLFASLGDRRRFLFGAGCNFSPLTPFQNLISFRDAAWKYGRFTT